MIQISKVSYPKPTQRTILKILKSGRLAQGKYVNQFEEEFSKYIGCDYAIAVNSGTSALHLSLLSLGIGPGDEVIVPAFTFVATANVVLLVGAKPIFVDVDASTFNVTLEQIESQISNRTKAIIVVHLYGLPCDIVAIAKLAQRHKLILIEDCAQACGAQVRGKMVGSFGDVGCFSFYATKNLSTGEGGMVTTNSPIAQRMVKLYRNQGMIKRYENEIPGFNNRMQEISAIMGLSQLNSLDSRNQKRSINAEYFKKNLPTTSLIELPKSTPESRHVYHQFTLKINPKYRDQLMSYLNKNGIEANIYYPVPIYHSPAFNENLYLTNTELLCKSVLSIPIHPQLKKKQLRYITHKIVEWLGKV
jgi:dTDP-4-amino-4,6-dideoxygalactose transaminase